MDENAFDGMEAADCLSPHYINVGQAASTNSLLAEMDGEKALPHGTVLRAVAQTAGRGQRGNSWESEPGQNLTFSMLLRPEGIAPAEQFVISEAVALAVADAVATALAGTADAPEVTVKWPNDIYAGDEKIAGILIENTITGRAIDRSIAGIGLNVNQTFFVSDAPNPVSLAMLSGRRHELEPILRGVAEGVLANLKVPAAELHARYLSRLWRREGYHEYTVASSGEKISARIAGVEPDGHLLLARGEEDEPEAFAFKEVAAVL